MPFPEPIYTSNDWTVKYATSAPVLSAPIESINVDYILKQRFSILANHFEKAELNTPYTEYFPGGADFPEYSDFVLVREPEQPDANGGCLEWEATFATVPATHREPTEMNWLRPGFYGL